DLGVQPILTRYLADDDELLGCDLAARDPGYDRVGAVLLHVGQIIVIRVLQRCPLARQHKAVPTRGQNGGDGRLADIATQSAAVRGEHSVKALQTTDPHQMEELL